MRADRKKPNIIIFCMETLGADHLSCYGYRRLTSPHLDEMAAQGTLFENHYSQHVPTTPGYATLTTGMDCFGNECVALRHQGPLTSKVRTLPEILKLHGYVSTCVGFTGNPSARGFDKYLDSAESWGSWNDRPLRKAERLNDVTLPEIKRLDSEGKPFLLLLRHMEPHSPYLPPPPFDKMFYQGDPCDPRNLSMKPVFDFKPFGDFFKSWMPPGLTDKDYVIAQYDGEIAYMDACIRVITGQLKTLGILDNTILVFTSDHGENLYNHECWFDHHGMYEPNLHVPLFIRYPGVFPAGKRVRGFSTLKDIAPTLMEAAGIREDIRFDGKSLTGLLNGDPGETEFYITECTWMRKHGWRTPDWKMIQALEPDFHGKPALELYNLAQDPQESQNLAEIRPDIVGHLSIRMDAFIARREKETGIGNPMFTQGDWHGYKGLGPFKSSEQAYNTLYIGSVADAKKIQAESRKS